MNEGLKKMADRLYATEILSQDELIELIRFRDREITDYIMEQARKIRNKHYGNQVYVRGLIEISNYCKNDCYYCGIRRSNRFTERYRLETEDILNCCRMGYEQGFRTFVLQGGEDLDFTEKKMANIIEQIKKQHPDCAVTLSLGEKSAQVYKTWFEAGADRYLLRHESADDSHYSKLHPANMSLLRRKQCLWELKEIGYQVGAGFMVGAPYQTFDNLADDLLFLKQLNPQMVGIGPFIPAQHTPFEQERSGSIEMTLFLLAIIRCMLPAVLLPATTALGTLDQNGRIKGMNAGANVVMPNISPLEARAKYALYNKKINSGAEGGESLTILKQQMADAGYEVVVSRGDAAVMPEQARKRIYGNQ